jgi:arginine-tRNA-protein transferase
MPRGGDQDGGQRSPANAARGQPAALDLDRLPRSPLHPCPYLEGRLARERAFAADAVSPETYHELMDRGFRRAGRVFYAPDCPGCARCVPLRVPVAEFRPSRSQRRVLRRNVDVHISVRRPHFSGDALELHKRWLHSQHGGDGDDETPESMRESLYAPVVDSVEILYELGGRLAAVSLLDVCSRSVSAVYHFFAPELARRSLGVFSALTEIAWTRDIGVPHYYFGYWVEGAKAMQYKASYRPHELLRDGAWQRA